MKKLIVVLILLFAATTVFAQVQIPAANVGKWLDPNYDAVWDFATNGVRILNPAGAVLYDFAGKITNFNVTVDGINPVISFRCDDAGRSYRFTWLFSGNWTMEITRPDEPLYTVELRKQEN
jgi:hypothetical protein